MKTKKNFWFLVSLLLGHGQSFAIPSKTVQHNLSGVNIPGVEILADHENSNVLYVSPSTTKTLMGEFVSTNSSFDCDDLGALRSELTHIPADKNVIHQIIDSDRYVSAYFDEAIRIPYKTAKISFKIIDRKEELDDFHENNQLKIEGYEKAKANKSYYDAEWEVHQGKMDSLREDYRDQMADAEMNPNSDAQERRQLRQRAFEFYNQRRADLMDVGKQLRAKREQAAREFAYMTGKLGPLVAKQDYLRERLEEAINDYESLKATLNGMNESTLAKLAELEKRQVGYVSGGIGLYTDELDRVKKELERRGLSHIQVNKLQLYNVHYSNLVDFAPGKVEGVDGPILSSVAMERVGTNGTEDLVDSAFIDKKTGRYIKVPANQAAFGKGVGSVLSRVSQGQYCGNPKTEKSSIVLSTSGGNQKIFYQRISYQKHDDDLMSLHVGFSYDYNVKASPISAKCTLDLSDTFEESTRKSKKSSRRWFRKITTTSSSQTIDIDKNIGLSCEFDENPMISDDPAENADYFTRLRETLKSETYAMFVNQFAHTYTTRATNPEVMPTRYALAELGQNIRSVCSGNMYCQITGLVLIGLDKLGGTRQYANSYAKRTLDGEVSLDYSRHGFIATGGTSSIELRVTR